MKRYFITKREMVNGIERVEMIDTRRSSVIRKCSQQEVDEMVDNVNKAPLSLEEKEQLRNMLQRLGHFDLADELSGHFRNEK